MPKCIQCKTQFDFDTIDKKFFEKMAVPEPKRCHLCRRRLMLAWTNELNLYQRKCDFTGETILTMYKPDTPFPVYKTSIWHSDKWDAKSYGQDIDFNRPFFEQWNALRNRVPHYSRLVLEETMVNSDYVNFCSNLKNCYLIFDSDYSENCYYSYTVQNDKDVVDCLKVRQSELCFECIDCAQCYNCRYCQNTQNSTDCVFGYNLQGCIGCFGCVNLKNASYHWFNEKLTKEEYTKRISEIDLGSRAETQKWAAKFEEYKKQFPKLFMHGINNVDSTGDYLSNSKNALDCYDSFRVEDSRYVYSGFLPLKDCYEAYQCGEDSSLFYYTALGGFSSYNIKFCWGIFEGCADIEYSMHTRSSKNCFGCVGLNKAQYCILNKQYTKEEYEKLRVRLIEHMKQTGEYGEYFPTELSPFAYNQSNAQIEMPLNKDEAERLGFKWEDEKRDWQKSDYKMPDNIKDVGDEILRMMLSDTDTGQNYKIIKQELDFYRKIKAPAPLNCFIERHKKRLLKRNARKLYERKCDKCSKEIKTTWPPETKEKIYCKECFLSEVI